MNHSYVKIKYNLLMHLEYKRNCFYIMEICYKYLEYKKKFFLLNKILDQAIGLVVYISIII